jgi:hypothetical protein
MKSGVAPLLCGKVFFLVANGAYGFRALVRELTFKSAPRTPAALEFIAAGHKSCQT